MKTIDCPVCGERALAMRRGVDRRLRHRNAELTIPDDIELPECASCGARPISMKLAKKLEPVLEAAWSAQLRRWAAASLETLERVRPLYEWERLLNVSVGYLSKLKTSKSPSAQLVALLRLIANDPSRAGEIESLWANERTLVVHESIRVASPQPVERARPKMERVLRNVSLRTAA